MHAQKTRAVLEHTLLATHIFVIILLLAESKLVIPTWLSVIGRLHPVLLHFPIVLLLLAVVVILFPGILRNEKDQLYYGTYLLLWGCVLSAFTVIAGLFLSLENAGGSSLLQNHKWTGIGVFWLSSALYVFSDKLIVRPALEKITIAFMGILIIATGHFGASLTHGENFITGPLQKRDVQLVSLEEAEVFEDVIQPILENKCIGCHKGSKQKGELRLDGVEHILKGGESGPAVVPGDVEKSLLAHHILLPLEEEGHMPPKSKTQLTEEETELIISWIASGGDFNKKVLAYEFNTPLFQLASQRFEDIPKAYTFQPASPDQISSLNSFYRKVTSLGGGSPALSVSYFSQQNFDPQSFDELLTISEQVVELNLNHMPVKDEDLAPLSNLPNLEKLYLNFSDLQGEGLKHLISLPHLSSLSLSGSPLNETALVPLAELKALDYLYIWNTGLSNEQIADLQKTLPNTFIETGFADDGTIYQLNPPTLKCDSAFFNGQTRIEILHPIKSTAIYYTLDGSEPDSIHSTLYTAPLSIDSNVTVRAKAFAEGWTGSSETEAEFIKSSVRPDKYHLNFPPSDRYKGDLVNSLFDGKKGKRDVWDLAWLGFNHTPLDVEMEFHQPKDITDIKLNIWYQGGSWLFPPAEVQIWTAEKEGEWKMVHQSRPAVPGKDDPSSLKLLSIPFKISGVQKMRLVAKPSLLPKWHGAAGQQGWLMIDELVMN
jgi:uncharacterized membrane protein